MTRDGKCAVMLVLAWMFTRPAWAVQAAAIRLYPGYVTRLQCEGRLLVSSVGNDALVRLDALPKELGCAVLLKPSGPVGRTNLVLETSTGTIERIVEVEAVKERPGAEDLSLRGGEGGR